MGRKSRARENHSVIHMPVPPPSTDKSANPKKPAPVRRKRAQWSFRLKLTVAFLLAPLAIAAGYGVPQIMAAWKAHKAKVLIEDAIDYQKKNEMDKAFPLLIQAYRSDSHNPDVLRWLARGCDSNRGAANEAVRYWKELVSSPSSTDEDRQGYLAALIRNSEFTAARKYLESWPQALRGQHKSKNLEVALLHTEGKDQEAQGLMRRTLEEDSQEVESRIKLDQLNLSASFDDLREAARRDLWEIVNKGTDASPNALLVLARAPGLSLKEANDILALLNGKPFEKKERLRHDIIDACLAVYPDLAASVLARERQSAENRSLEENEEYFRWMVTRGESRWVLAQLSERTNQQSNAATLFEDGGSKHLAPKVEVLHSPVLFSTYADCLMNEKKWVELERLLHRDGLPFSSAKLELMRGMCSQGMGAANVVVHDHLGAALLYAAKTHNAEDLATVEMMAEKMEFLPIAVQACEVQAQESATRLEVLKKEFELQHNMGDADGMLRTALALVEMRPGLRPYEEQTHYLRLLTGQDLEPEIQLAMDRATDSPAAANASQWVCAALAAYLSGDHEGARLRLRLVDVSELKPIGLRAVTAGLLAETGDAEKAFAVAERISAPSTLLPEERWFLQQALK